MYGQTWSATQFLLSWNKKSAGQYIQKTNKLAKTAFKQQKKLVKKMRKLQQKFHDKNA